MYGRHINWKKKKIQMNKQTKLIWTVLCMKWKWLLESRGKDGKRCSGGLEDQVSFFPESAETDLTKKTNFQWNFPNEGE